MLSLKAVIASNHRWVSFLSGLLLGFLLLYTQSHRVEQAKPSPLSLVSGAPTDDFFHDFRKSPRCNLSSASLHDAHTPPCLTRSGLLRAMSDGGRRGWGKPYHPRGCDMRFFGGEGACSVLGRFDRIWLVGDASMRQLSMALLALLRRDLVDGARANWSGRLDRDESCDCRALFERPECEPFTVANSDAVRLGDPDSIRCVGKRIASISYIPAPTFPLTAQHLSSALAHIREPVSQSGRDVLIVGHGVENDFDVGETLSWLEQLETALAPRIPGLYASGEGAGIAERADADSVSDWTAGERADAAASVPRLLITPSAQGFYKPEELASRQNNIKLMRFTRAMSTLAAARGYEVLKTYNMSVQLGAGEDGTASTLEGTVMKAQFVLGWLDALATGAEGTG